MKKRVRFYRYTAGILIFALLSGLTGCRLAVDKEGGKLSVNDVLCGAFLAFNGEEINKEADNTAMEPSMGGGVKISGKALFEGKDIVKGVQEDNTVRFEGVKGYFFGIISEKKENVENSVLMADDGFTNVGQNVQDNDGKTETISEATFLVPTDSTKSYYIYPVYRKGDGTYYTMLENARGTSFTGDTVNTSTSTKFDNVMEMRNDGLTKKYTKQSIKLTLKTVDPAKKIVIKEMNRKDEVIASAELKNNGSTTIRYKAAPEADYVIVEETLHNNRTGDYVQRSAYSFGKEKIFYHQCSFPNEKDGIGAVHLEISK
ncbi:hypothetical protein SAMN02745136_02640 [Anaerocolumna jejuensis DSM 15929]|uniref:Lipoprotein n=1 Tax=Anaerocolumna jejuensis DSM 15929 TaxID=1121322 RepID=A0A1M6SXT4_9FIRM|nr:hypothetical protein [Anaerocolumna jejuensis]SHK49503.1 hypothetical protein SAMN02745136_02640 [Anaerocolumna jejuensis DSM 15929]